MIGRRTLFQSFLTAFASLLFVRSPKAESNPVAQPRNAATSERAVWKSFYEDTRVWGYVDKHSVTPGERFNIMLSTGPGQTKLKGKIEIFRIGYYAKADRELVWEGGDVEASRQEVQMTQVRRARAGQQKWKMLKRPDGGRDITLSTLLTPRTDTVTLTWRALSSRIPQNRVIFSFN